MPRIIMKSPYIKPNSKTHIGNYVSYIATRDGVEKADSTQKFMEATERQKQIIKKLLSDYPDSKDLYEYQDYLDKPNRGNADELILRIAETHAELFGDREKYVSYIAQRPRVEKVSSHGLFTDDGVPIVLSDVQKEVAESKSNVWTHIISLKREDAERLGYNNAKAWMNLIRSQRNMIAENMKIAPENFRWYAAFHNEGHHPHIHMIAYSTNPNEAYLSEKGIENIKSNLAKVIFRQDLISIYQKQTEHRDKLRAEARDIVEDLVSKINSEIYISASIQNKLLELADRLSKTSGKKVYGYLKPDVKALVDSIVDELSNDERIAKLYDLWYEQKENTIRTYTDELPDRIPIAQNKEFKSIKNAVIKEALKLIPNEDEAESKKNTDEESVSLPFEYEENTSAESVFDSGRGVLYPQHYSIKTSRNSVAISSLYLLRYLCNMIQSQLRFEEKQKAQRTDKKLQQKINDKKQAQGVKM
ncbi:MAG: MobP3 family relaxase [Ruminococcus sp.]|nr:MobP3 family relaxase [Ruminococcus sp.]